MDTNITALVKGASDGIWTGSESYGLTTPSLSNFLRHRECNKNVVSGGSRISGLLPVVSAFALAFLALHTISYAQTSDEAQIRALEHRFADGFKAKDVDSIMANYDHSRSLAFFDVVPRREYLGWDAYKRDWQDFFESVGPITLFEVKDLAVNVDGSVAYSYSFQHYLATTKAGGPRDLTVRVTDVYRKNRGKWLIVQEHVSVPVDPQTGRADLGPKP